MTTPSKILLAIAVFASVLTAFFIYKWNECREHYLQERVSYERVVDSLGNLANVQNEAKLDAIRAADSFRGLYTDLVPKYRQNVLELTTIKTSLHVNQTTAQTAPITTVDSLLVEYLRSNGLPTVFYRTTVQDIGR